MSFSVPPVDQALLPAAVQSGTPAQKQAYTTALGFEQILVDQLAQELSASTQSQDGVDGPYAQMLPTALSSGVMSAGGLGIAQQLAGALNPGTGAGG